VLAAAVPSVAVEVVVVAVVGVLVVVVIVVRIEQNSSENRIHSTFQII
jgi:hypothetical protein